MRPGNRYGVVDAIEKKAPRLPDFDDSLVIASVQDDSVRGGSIGKPRIASKQNAPADPPIGAQVSGETASILIESLGKLEISGSRRTGRQPGGAESGESEQAAFYQKDDESEDSACMSPRCRTVPRVK